LNFSTSSIAWQIYNGAWPISFSFPCAPDPCRRTERT
jgi:hypothetical protein